MVVVVVVGAEAEETVQEAPLMPRHCCLVQAKALKAFQQVERHLRSLPGEAVPAGDRSCSENVLLLQILWRDCRMARCPRTLLSGIWTFKTAYCLRSSI